MRGRKSSIRYYESKGGYFTHYRGRKHRLATGPDDAPSGPTFLAALEKFRELMQLSQATTAGNENTLGTIINLYFRFVEEHRKLATLKIRQITLTPFLSYGKTKDLRVSTLESSHIKAFIEHMRGIRNHRFNGTPFTWHNGSIRNFMDSLHACLNWAVKGKLIQANPIKGMEKPTSRSRGGECRVTAEMHQRALQAAKPDFRRLLVVLEATGCRPSELFNAEARHFDEGLGAIVYRGKSHLEEGETSHKTSHKDKDRIIFLSGEALEIVRELVKLYPQGPLFRSERGKERKLGRWNQGKIQRQIKSLRKRADLPATFTLYSYRHEAHTAYLEAGGSIEDLAALMGNTPEVIRRHYSHLTDNPQRLRKLAEDFRARMHQK